MGSKLSILAASSLSLFFWVSCAVCEDGPHDLNDDSIVSFQGFGDSITYGVGDDTAVGTVVEDPNRTDGTAGYLRRVRELAGLTTVNSGVPGEKFSEEGIDRLPGSVAGGGADYVGILEGANDAIIQVAPSDFRNRLQKAINVVYALGKEAVILTVPRPCCEHSGLPLFTSAYSSIERDLASINGVPLADLEKAWLTTCQDREKCELFNTPEGLHPNSLGYDIIGQTVLAALYGVDLFNQDGAGQLEEKLGLPEGAIVVKPDPEQ